MKLFSEAYVGRKNVTNISYRKTVVKSMDDLTYSNVGLLTPEYISKQFSYYFNQILIHAITKLKTDMGDDFFSF